LVKKVGECTNWLGSKSWKERNDGYSSASINPKLLASLSENKLGPVYGHIFIDDEESGEPKIQG